MPYTAFRLHAANLEALLIKNIQDGEERVLRTVFSLGWSQALVPINHEVHGMN